MDAPDGLSERGTALWQAMTRARPFSPSAAVLLGEACRLTDRLERLDGLLRGDLDAWASIRQTDDGEPMVLVISSALSEARQQASTLRQIIATIEEMTPKESDEPSDALARLLSGGLSAPVRDSTEPGSNDPRVAGR